MENIYIIFLNFYMINFKPILALSVVLIGFLISLSVVFLDVLGPNVPLPRKSIFDILDKLNKNSSSSVTKENINTDATKKLAKKYLNQQNLVHGYSVLNFNPNLSDPENGNFTFLSALCYGSSQNDCIYLNAYMKSLDYGDTWKIGFLE